MHDDMAFLRGARITFTPEELDALERGESVSALPKFVWTLLGGALLVLLAIGWLAYHDRYIRATAALHTTIEAKDDSIRVLETDIAQLGKAIKAADDAWAKAKGTVVRVAYVDPKLRDSLAVLNRTLDSIGGSGGTTVPIAVAREFRTQLNACTVARDNAVASAMIEESACETATRLRDAKIDSLTKLKQLTEDKLAATVKLVGAARPRFSPYAGFDYSLVRKTWTETVGANVRLFGGLSALGAVRYRDSADVVVGLRYNFR